MKTGTKNIKLGLLILVLAGLFAFYLGFSIPAHMSDGIYEMNMGRVTLRAGHTHGMLIGLCNIVVGILLTTQSYTRRSANLVSWAGVSSILLPVGLILRGVTNGSATFAPVAMIGGLGLLTTFVVLLIGFGKGDD